MSIKVEWADRANRVIAYICTSEWNWKLHELGKGLEHELLAEAGLHREDCSLILDFGHRANTKELALLPFRNLVVDQPYKTIVVVTTSHWIAIMASIVQEVYKTRNLFVYSTMQKALEHLQGSFLPKTAT